MSRVWQFLGGLVGAVGLIAAANATPFSFQGTSNVDDQVFFFTFTVGSTSVVTMETFDYAGGTDLNGNAIFAGGFDPILALFSSTGALIDEVDDGGANSDPLTSAALDALMIDTLGPGTYILALAEFDNFALGPNLADGFLEGGAGNFTAAFGCTNGRFCDVTGANRTGAFDVSVSGAGVTAAQVPEPSTIALIGLGLVGLGAMRRNRRVIQG